jgi:CheY-specific phosphatase CheX
MKKIEEMLTTAIFEVFEKMFFVFTEPLRGDGGVYDMKSSISFIGPAKGEMQILFSRGIAETMVENMLGLEGAEITSRIMEDCVKESLNIICGNFVRKLDPEKGFHLSIPIYEIITGNSQDNQEKQPGEIRLTFAAETGNMEIILTTAEMQ